MILDDSYGENIREPRVYSTYCPTIRSGREGLKVLEIYEQQKIREDSSH